jgi:XTP/dITP diphosphohydrolase
MKAEGRITKKEGEADSSLHSAFCLHPSAFLLLGTSNAGKVAELTGLLAGSGLPLRSLVDFDRVPEVAETGETLAENAAIKAIAYARHFGLWTLADDTALAVDALHGAPGIYSARYAGPQATGADNRRRLLDELAGVPLEKRAAHFACHLSLADPTGQIRATSEGRCQGRIGLAEVGGGGFGYDSLFEIVEYRRTFAELGPAAKSILSHRARAAEQMLSKIARLIAEDRSKA